MSGGTRAPTRAPRGRPAPGGRLARLGPRLAWALVALLALACAALAAALLSDDDEPDGAKATAGGEVKAPEPGGRPVGFPVRVEDAPSAVAVGPRVVWVVHEGSGTIGAVDPRRNELIGTPIAV